MQKELELGYGCPGGSYRTEEMQPVLCVCGEGMGVVLRMQKGSWFLPVPSSQSPVGTLEFSQTESLLGHLQEPSGI